MGYPIPSCIVDLYALVSNQPGFDPDPLVRTTDSELDPRPLKEGERRVNSRDVLERITVWLSYYYLGVGKHPRFMNWCHVVPNVVEPRFSTHMPRRGSRLKGFVAWLYINWMNRRLAHR